LTKAEPEVLFLDEPIIGLNVVSKQASDRPVNGSIGGAFMRKCAEEKRAGSSPAVVS
jgi:hypothetical protein